MPQESNIAEFAEALSFLHENYQIDFIDPLVIPAEVDNKAYYHLWEKEIEKRLDHYDAFFGFAFGGVILEQCFALFADLKKTILLFSTPTFADQLLMERLGTVVHLCKKNQVIEAINYLYDQVFYPNKPPKQYSFSAMDNEAEAASRLILGLERVLMTDSTSILQESTVKHLHFIGEHSRLVNQANVVAPKKGTLLTVPGAGMRVLQDNPSFCRRVILEQLGVLAAVEGF